MFYSQDSIVYQRICDWVGVYISILIICRLPSSSKEARMDWQRISVDTSFFCLYWRGGWVLSSAMEPCCQFVESNLLSWLETGLFGDFHATPWASNSMDKSHPITRNFVGWQVMASYDLLPHYLEVSLESPSYIRTFLLH